MDVVGSDYVYLSDECSQDVLSLWSDTWSVGDPVSMPEMNYDDVFQSELAPSSESYDDNGDWLSDALESVCPNTVVGFVSPQIVTSSCGSGERLPLTADCDSVLSPTDSGHYSIASSSTTATQWIVGDTLIEDDDCLGSVDEHTSDVSSQLENNNDIRVVVALAGESRDTSVNGLPKEMDNKSTAADTEFEFMSERPQHVAARRAEIALAREESDCDDEDDDDHDDDDDDVDEVEGVHFQRRHQLPVSEVTSSRRGRSRAAEVNRNAMNARINRQKKKAYMASLEAQKARLSDENKHMKSVLSSLVCERDDLADEVRYLKSVLANDSVLAKLVQSINGPPLKLTSTYDRAAQKRKDVESDHNYGPPGKLRASIMSDVKPGGICLHVSENQLSMELCRHCARMSQQLL